MSLIQTIRGRTVEVRVSRLLILGLVVALGVTAALYVGIRDRIEVEGRIDKLEVRGGCATLERAGQTETGKIIVRIRRKTSRFCRQEGESANAVLGGGDAQQPGGPPGQQPEPPSPGGGSPGDGAPPSGGGGAPPPGEHGGVLGQVDETLGDVNDTVDGVTDQICATRPPPPVCR